jgi:hypothetical protein
MNDLNKLLDELAHEIKMGDARQVLEERILPVLEAGQAMRDWLKARGIELETPSWDAAMTRLAGEGSGNGRD